MIKACVVLAFLTILIAVSQGQDYLDGGYVGSGNGEIDQYFVDPIFSSSSGHYLSSDPAVRGMQESIDMPRYSATYGAVTKRATGKITPGITTANAAGSWHMELSDGIAIDLILHQSGTVIFGQGSVTSGTISQWAASNGAISGNNLRLAVVPASGTVLYVVSLDIARPSLGGSFNALEADGQAKSGAARGNRIA
ncbi:Uncharacterised protein [uncultured archaeon]|nr:Uncharacterised protein [uncultured archaeon]